MPHSQYVPRKHPPSLVDRFYLNPESVALATGSAIVGLLLVPAAFFDLAISRALAGLPGWILLLLAVALLVGSAQFLHASLLPREKWSKPRIDRVKRGGTIALSCGWAGYVIAVLYTGNPYAVIAVITGASIAIGYLGRTRALKLSGAIVDQGLKAVKRDKG